MATSVVEFPMSTPATMLIVRYSREARLADGTP
jgi:hypothetical protein